MFVAVRVKKTSISKRSKKHGHDDPNQNQVFQLQFQPIRGFRYRAIHQSDSQEQEIQPIRGFPYRAIDQSDFQELEIQPIRGFRYRAIDQSDSQELEIQPIRGFPYRAIDQSDFQELEIQPIRRFRDRAIDQSDFQELGIQPITFLYARICSAMLFTIEFRKILQLMIWSHSVEGQASRIDERYLLFTDSNIKSIYFQGLSTVDKDS